MAGAELEVEAWAPVPQGRGYECKDAGSLPLWNSLGNVATAGMLAAPEAEGAAEHKTRWQGLLFQVSKPQDRKSTRLNSSHIATSRMPSSA